MFVPAPFNSKDQYFACVLTWASSSLVPFSKVNLPKVASAFNLLEASNKPCALAAAYKSAKTIGVFTVSYFCVHPAYRWISASIGVLNPKTVSSFWVVGEVYQFVNSL